MIVEVPFVYERRAREPGKRKYVPMKLRSVASVRLGEIARDAFPVAIAMDRWDAAAGAYRHDAQYRVHDGALHVALLGYGPARHTPQATLEAMLAHIAKGCRTDLSRGLPQHEPTFRDPAVEATLHLDPDDPGDRDELAAEIARNAAATLVCEGALWRRIHDEPLLVAIPADRVNGPMLDVRFRSTLMARGPLDCARHFRVDQLAEGLLALGIDADFDLDAPETFAAYVPILPRIEMPEMVRYRHDQGPALVAAAKRAKEALQSELHAMPTPVLVAWAALRDDLEVGADPSHVAESFARFTDAVGVADLDEEVPDWRVEIEKWRNSPHVETDARHEGPRP
jgi:hypothetical protein